MAAFAAFKEEIKAGQDSVKEEMKAVQESVKDQMKLGQESVKEEMRAIKASQEELKKEITCIIENKFEAMEGRIDAVENKVSSVKEQIEERVSAVEQQIDYRVSAVKEQIQERVSAVKEQIQERVSAVEQQIDDKVSAVAKEVDTLKKFVATAGSNSDTFKFLAMPGHPSLKLSTYGGKTSWKVYKTQFSIVAEANGWDSQAKACPLASSLTADAADILQTLPENKRLDFEALSGALELRFGEKCLKDYSRLQLKSHFKNNKLFSAFEAMTIDRQKASSTRNADVSSERPCSESCRNHTEIEEKPETTSNSPAQMLFGRDLRLPCDLLFGRPPDAPSSPEEYIQDLQEQFEVMHNVARERVNLATEKMKTHYNTRATGYRFNEGDRVWLWNPTRRKGLSPKLQSPWDGPYTVLNRLNDVVVRIRVDFFSWAEAKIDFKGGELTLNMKPIEAKNDKPPQLDLQHLPAEEKEKIQGLGIETDQSKIVAIRNYPVPKTAKKLSSFLGMCSYYRAFIKDFAKIAEPLLKLKRKKARFSWSAEANLAFQKLKDALTQAPVLKFPEGDKGLEISADASDFAIGAVLSQNGQPVAFFSRTLNETQRNYSATERETLAVLASVQKFRVFFGSSPVTVYTDHAAVTRLYSGKNLSPRLIRWALKLQEYNLIIKHTPGKENVVADALSRINLDENGSVIKIAMLTSKVLDSRETVIAELKKDPEFKNIYNYLADPENFNHPDIVPIRNRAENYELIDGLLFYTKATNENHEYRPVIPASMRLNVLEELHDCAISAHLGIRKTVQRVREAVFFPELQKFTRAYVQSCPTCQLNNYVNFRPAGFLNSIKSEFPNQIIGIDLLGPYPRSKVNKSRYLLVIVDHFSKWLELIPLKRASAKIVVDSILNKYILKYGAPLKVISDNGPQFVSKMFEEMCAKLGIRHLKMVPYRPQSNIAERVNRNVVKIIRSYVKNYHSTWDSHINEFAFALRTAKHDTTQKTPAELFLGRKILTPLDKLFFVQERAEEFKMSDIQKLIREATENIEMAQRKQKLYYDLKRREVKYNVGDEVLKIKHNLSNAPEEKVGKFFPRFEGPFTIEQITGAVVILKRNDGQTLKANVDQIKPFYNRSKMAVFKDSFQDPRQSTSQEDIRQQKQQEPATTASKCQKKKAPPQQRNKNQKGGFKRKSHDAGEQIYERNYERTKRRKQNGQGKPNVSKRTVESSDRCLRSKKRRLQPENQLPEYSRNQDKQRARAQERRAQSTKRPAEQPPLQRKLPRIQRRNFKRKRDEQAPKEQRKTRKLNQATTYSSFKDWAKKRMDDHNKINFAGRSKTCWKNKTC
ncbi:Retrotransposable element Tf2 protein type 2, partial [Stegodyphus mimosarum]